MRILLSLIFLIATRLSIAQIFPWQPNEVVLNQKDTFILVERIEFDTDNRVRWLTGYEYDESGINVHKTELDGSTNAFYEELSLLENDSNTLLTRYRNYQREHQDSVKRLASISCYDDKSRLLWEHTYDISGGVVDSVENLYDGNLLIGQNTWSSSLDWSRTQWHEQIGRMRVSYSDSGQFRTTSFITIKHYQNGMESKSSSTRTYRYDREQKLVEERCYSDNSTAGHQVRFDGKNGQFLTSSREVGDSLQKVVLRKYDADGNLVYVSHASSLDTEPFHQEYFEFDGRGRPVKSFTINADGIRTDLTLIKYRKRGKNTEVRHTHVADKFRGGETSVSLMDSKNRFLESVTFFEGEKAMTDEWCYSQKGDQYQVELKQYFFPRDEGDPEMVLTRWMYTRKST